MQECEQAYSTLQKNDQKKRRKKKDKGEDCCDPSAVCEIENCVGKNKYCELPDLSCDCWP
ncbi:hypothetical protein VAZ01S_052_00130 [Vibrio azureus NBRC 104587]|uniref:Uncharacterized protein n=2 Tax=Vibrio azureus TaxID=512649 RepID=U3ASP3_9VIBR|nr:hypothetical protein VAZ01S_052_00130 [Vibrio azureus NBRC 104587]